MPEPIPMVPVLPPVDAVTLKQNVAKVDQLLGPSKGFGPTGAFGSCAKSP